MKRLLFSIIALLLACCMLWGCAPKNDIPDSTEPPELNTSTPEPAVTAEPEPLTAGPTEEPTPETTAEPTPEPTEAPTPVPERFVFEPKVCSAYHEEVFGETMCETWFNLVDAVMAGENTFACPDQHTYDWVMGQFPKRCFPVLVELIDYAYDRAHSVNDGVASFTWLVPPEEAAARIAEFAEQIEGILNDTLEPGWSAAEKALALYIYFSDNYKYDWDTYELMYQEPVNYMTTYRVFKTGMGVCGELAPAYSYLLMQAGVDATTMMGVEHEWSYVRINGRNYHIDPTFVLDTDGALEYFMMTDDQRAETGYSKERYVITSIYSEDHPHPDYVADDNFFAPIWDYWYQEMIPNEDMLRGWHWTEGWEKEYLEFDYSAFDRQ